MKTMKTIEIKRLSGEIAFSHKCKDNTFSKTLMEAFRKAVDLTYCNFNSCEFIKVSIPDMDFDHSSFAGARFYSSNLCHSSFAYSNFDIASFVRSSFAYSNFHDSRFAGASFSDSMLSMANFSCASFNGSSFVRSGFDGSRFSDSSFDGSSFSDSSFYSSNFAGASFDDDCEFINTILPMFCKLKVCIKNNEIVIGCKSGTIQYWDGFFDSDKVFETPRNTPEFNRIYAVYLAHKIYLETLLTNT